MKAVKVQYTVKPDYVETNKKNIKQVMADLRAQNSSIKYSAFLLDDGQTFVHIVVTADDETQSVGDLDSFKKFQQELKASQPEVPPKAEDMSLVASAYDIV